MTVLATAGHVDHGKSTLVNFLTGQETDRLKEEKQRGLTINLGYTFFEYNNTTYSIVDVPGHQDFFKNTISGFANIDGVLFCVDSHQGWSVQSEEHFQALINLNIKNILFILTKSDLDEHTVDYEFIENKCTVFDGLNFEVISFSNLTSDVNKIKKNVGDFFSKHKSKNSTSSMWVDRSFTIDGIGKVITGTATKNLGINDLYLNHHKEALEIKNIESKNKNIDNINTSTRLAISLKKSSEVISKGDLVSNNQINKSEFIILNPYINSNKFSSSETIRVYIGTSHQIAKKIKFINLDGNDYLVVHLLKPKSIPEKQNILLHNLTTNEFAGGEVVFKSSNNYLLKNLLKGSIRNSHELVLIPEQLKSESKEYFEINKTFIESSKFQNLISSLIEDIEKINKFGVDEYLYKKFYIEENDIQDFLSLTENLELLDNKLRVPSDESVNLEIYKLICEDLTEELSVQNSNVEQYDKEAVKNLFMKGYLVRVSKSIFISKDHIDLLKNNLSQLPKIFTVSEFKDINKISRKYAIPYLEYLDQNKLTKKIDNDGKRENLIS